MHPLPLGSKTDHFASPGRENANWFNDKNHQLSALAFTKNNLE